MSEQKQEIFPIVTEQFTEGFPGKYRPYIQGWSFTTDELQETLLDGTYKMLTLDLSINEDGYAKIVNAAPENERSRVAEERYGCDVKCAHCFECRTETNNALMTFDEVKKVVLEAKKLGLKTVKFLGAVNI